MEEEQQHHHWDERRRIPDGGYPQGPPGLLGVRPGMPGLQPQGPVVGLYNYACAMQLSILTALETLHITLPPGC